MSQALTRVALLDIRTQALLHRLAWARTLSLRARRPRASLAAILSLYVLFGVISIAGSGLILWTVAVGWSDPTPLLGGAVLAAFYALAGLAALIGGPAAVLLARIQNANVWTNAGRTAFALVRRHKGSPTPFNHFARPGHGRMFREQLGRELLREHRSILVRTSSSAVRAHYEAEARAAGLTITPASRRYIRITASPPD